MIRKSPAALQLALLGGAVALLSRDEGMARTAARHLADAARRMATTRLDDLGAAAGKMVLGVVRERVGGPAADAIGEFVRDLSTSVDERLAARISAVGDGEVMDVIAGFAEETAKLAPDRDVLLFLDQAERLDQDDIRRLADFIGRLPGRVGIRLAYATVDSSAQASLDDLGEAGAAVTVLAGLDPEQVAAWLANTGVPAGMLGEVMRVTGGYPFHVLDAIDAVRDGSSLADLRPRETTGRGTRRAWGKLDPGVRRAAIMLSAFTDPPPRRRIPRYLGLDPAGWAVVEQQLWDARIFATVKDQTRWFHEMRRRYLWQEVLTEAQRHEIAPGAVAELSALMKDIGVAGPARLVEFARLLPLADNLLTAEPATRFLVSAGIAAIAVAAAVMELGEPGGSLPGAEVILLYAREVFGAHGDLTAALRSLLDQGLVRVHAGPHGVAVLPSWADDHAGPAIAGRAAAELGRVPVPRVATAAFESFLRSRLSGFTHVQYGVGRPRLADLSAYAVNLHRTRQDGVLVLGRKSPSLLMRADWDKVPIYTTAVYPDAAARDLALAEIRQLISTQPGPQLTRFQARAYPMPRVRCRRFLRAYERLTGTAIGSMLSIPQQAPRRPWAVPVSEWAHSQAAVFAFARDATSPEERSAFDLDEPTGVLFTARDGYLAAQVRNRVGAGQASISAAENFADPFSRLALARAAGLTADQYIGRWIYGPGLGPYQDPVVETLIQISTQAAVFNQQQHLVAVDTTPTALQDALTAAAEQEAADAAALAPLLGGKGTGQEVTGRTTYLLLWADDRTWRLPGIEEPQVTGGYIDHDRDIRQIVRVAIRPPVARDQRHGGGRLPCLQEAFGLSPEQVRSTTWRDRPAIFTIAEMLGFTTTDIRSHQP
jgi:hypothetical protein